MCIVRRPGAALFALDVTDNPAGVSVTKMNHNMIVKESDPIRPLLLTQAVRSGTNGRWLMRCEHCEGGFFAKRCDARFCGAACRVADKRATNKLDSMGRSWSAVAALETKRAQTIERNCEYCGRKFWTDGTQGAQIYCTAACRQGAYRRRKNSAQEAQL